MRLTLSSLSALRVMRALRGARGHVPGTPCDLSAPDPSPARRFTAKRLPLDAIALDSPPDSAHPLHVAVPTPASRIQGSFASCTVYERGLPGGSFVDLGNGIALPCPELLFLELARIMDPATHALLGYELCGTFSRDPHDPRCGEVTHGVMPATSVSRIERFLASCGRVRGVAAARRSLAYVRDNAWSPMEAILALMLVLPTSEYGYGLADVTLNARHESDPELVRRGIAATRVPDIELSGSSVGFNYDGRNHLDLNAVARAQDCDALLEAARVRQRYVGDLRRNRELASQGRIILPVVSEDLFTPGALDTLVLEAVLTMEALGERSSDDVRALLASWPHAHMRQLLVWSLLPWRKGAAYARERLNSHVEGCSVVYEEEIEFPM